MPKPKEEYRDRSLATLAISLPRDGKTSILELNPWLIGLKFVCRTTGNLLSVFPECAQTSRHVLVEHAVRVGWFESPHRTQSDIKKRAEDAAATGGYRKIDPRSSSELEVHGGRISDKALYFAEGTKAREYLFNFLEYQGHPIWEIYNKHLLLYNKVYSFFESIDWVKNKPRDPKEIQQATDFIESSITIMRSLQSIHHDMIFRLYEKDKIKTQLSNMDEGKSVASLEDDSEPTFDGDE